VLLLDYRKSPQFTSFSYIAYNTEKCYLGFSTHSPPPLRPKIRQSHSKDIFKHHLKTHLLTTP